MFNTTLNYINCYILAFSQRKIQNYSSRFKNLSFPKLSRSWKMELSISHNFQKLSKTHKNPELKLFLSPGKKLNFSLNRLLDKNSREKSSSLATLLSESSEVEWSLIFVKKSSKRTVLEWKIERKIGPFGHTCLTTLNFEVKCLL